MAFEFKTPVVGGKKFFIDWLNEQKPVKRPSIVPADVAAKLLSDKLVNIHKGSFNSISKFKI